MMFRNDKKSFLVEIAVLLVSVGSVSYTTSCCIRRDFNQRSDEFRKQYTSDQAEEAVRRVARDQLLAEVRSQGADMAKLLAAVETQGAGIEAHSGKMQEILGRLDGHDAWSRTNHDRIMRANKKLDVILAAMNLAEPATRPSSQPIAP